MPLNLLEDSGCGLQIATTSFSTNTPFATLSSLLSQWSSDLTAANISFLSYIPNADLVTNWTYALNVTSSVSSCVVSYKHMLDDLSGWLTQRSLSLASEDKFDITPSIDLVNAFVKSGSVLKANVTRYLRGTMSKLELANAYSGWNDDLLNNADLLVNDIMSSVIAKLTSSVDSQQLTLIDMYQNLMEKLVEINSFLASNDSSVDNVARLMSIWQEPIIGLQYSQVSMLQLP
jgi:hypothetical protein